MNNNESLEMLNKQICLYQLIEYRAVFFRRLLISLSFSLVVSGFILASYFYFFTSEVDLSIIGYLPIFLGLVLVGITNYLLPYNNIREIKILNHKISSVYSKFKSGHIEELRLKNNIDSLILHYLNNSNNIFSNYTVNKYFYNELN